MALVRYSQAAEFPGQFDPPFCVSTFRCKAIALEWSRDRCGKRSGVQSGGARYSDFLRERLMLKLGLASQESMYLFPVALAQQTKVSFPELQKRIP